MGMIGDARAGEGVSGLPPPLHKLNLKFHMIITTTHSHVFSVADKGESEGEQRPSQL